MTFTHTTREQKIAILEWLETGNNFRTIVERTNQNHTNSVPLTSCLEEAGKSSSPLISNKRPVIEEEESAEDASKRRTKKTEAYAMLAAWMREKSGSDWSLATTKSRLESYLKVYRKTLCQLMKPDFGVTPLDHARGIKSVPEKLNRLCTFFDRLDYMHRGDKSILGKNFISSVDPQSFPSPSVAGSAPSHDSPVESAGCSNQVSPSYHRMSTQGPLPGIHSPSDSAFALHPARSLGFINNHNDANTLPIPSPSPISPNANSIVNNNNSNNNNLPTISAFGNGIMDFPNFIYNQVNNGSNPFAMEKSDSILTDVKVMPGRSSSPILTSGNEENTERPRAMEVELGSVLLSLRPSTSAECNASNANNNLNCQNNSGLYQCPDSCSVADVSDSAVATPDDTHYIDTFSSFSSRKKQKASISECEQQSILSPATSVDSLKSDHSAPSEEYLELKREELRLKRLEIEMKQRESEAKKSKEDMELKNNIILHLVKSGKSVDEIKSYLSLFENTSSLSQS